MTPDQFAKISGDLLTLADSIARAKRPDYTQGHADILHNFNRAAEEAGITPLQAWLVHFHKQYSAVAKAAKLPLHSRSEPIDQRFADLINYCQLGLALFHEYAEANSKVEDFPR